MADVHSSKFEVLKNGTLNVEVVAFLNEEQAKSYVGSGGTLSVKVEGPKLTVSGIVASPAPKEKAAKK